MTWSSNFWDGTAILTSSVGAGADMIYYAKKYLETVKNNLVLIQAGQVVPLPTGSGKTVEWDRYLNLETSTPLTALTEGDLPAATSFYVQKLQRSIKEYGAWVKMSTLLQNIDLDPQAQGVSALLGEQAATILDTLCHFEVCANGANPLRADFKTNQGAVYKGTLTSVTNTTTLVCTGLSTNTDFGDADYDLNQSVIIGLTGRFYGQCRVITNYTQSAGTITVSPALDVLPQAGDTFRVVTPDDLHPGDVLSYEMCVRAARMLKEQKATTYEKGYYLGIIDPENSEALQNDQKWIAAHTYSDTMELYNGELGRLGKIRFVEETNPFTFPIATRGTSGSSYGPGAQGANFSASVLAATAPKTGYVKSNIFLGSNAFGVTGFQNEARTFSKPPITIMRPAQLAQPIPRFSTMGWQMDAMFASLNPLFAVQGWTYAEVA